MVFKYSLGLGNQANVGFTGREGIGWLSNLARSKLGKLGLAESSIIPSLSLNFLLVLGNRVLKADLAMGA